MYGRKLFIYLGLVGSLFAQENSISLAFGDLKSILEESSPELKLINASRKVTEARRDIALQWSNPVLYMETENVKNSNLELTEHSIYIDKTFSFPWNYWQERSIWSEELSAADQQKHHQTAQLLAAARSDYVKLRLLKDLTEKQKDLKESLDEMSLVVRANKEEGILSQIDETLFSMSIFGLKSDLLHSKKEYRETLKSLKKILGFIPGNEIILTTPIEFKSVITEFPDEENFLKNHPGLRFHQMQLATLDRRITLEKGRLMPSFSLQGGYKKINPDFEGYVLGISLPLPILNWNRPQIEKIKIRQQIQTVKTLTYQQQLKTELANLIQAIRENIQLIGNHTSEQQSSNIVQDLFYTYREGSISLPEFLNALQLYRDGSRRYTEQLITYYESVFDLEAETSQQLVTF